MHKEELYEYLTEPKNINRVYVFEHKNSHAAVYPELLVFASLHHSVPLAHTHELNDFFSFSATSARGNGWRTSPSRKS